MWLKADNKHINMDNIDCIGAMPESNATDNRTYCIVAECRGTAYTLLEGIKDGAELESAMDRVERALKLSYDKKRSTSIAF